MKKMIVTLITIIVILIVSCKSDDSGKYSFIGKWDCFTRTWSLEFVDASNFTITNNSDGAKWNATYSFLGEETSENGMSGLFTYSAYSTGYGNVSNIRANITLTSDRIFIREYLASEGIFGLRTFFKQ